MFGEGKKKKEEGEEEEEGGSSALQYEGRSGWVMVGSGGRHL